MPKFRVALKPGTWNAETRNVETENPECGTENPERMIWSIMRKMHVLPYFCDCEWFAKMQYHDTHFNFDNFIKYNQTIIELLLFSLQKIWLIRPVSVFFFICRKLGYRSWAIPLAFLCCLAHCYIHYHILP